MPFYPTRHSSQFAIFCWAPSNFLIEATSRRQRAPVIGEAEADLGAHGGELSGRVPATGNHANSQLSGRPGAEALGTLKNASQCAFRVKSWALHEPTYEDSQEMFAGVSSNLRAFGSTLEETTGTWVSPIKA